MRLGLVCFALAFVLALLQSLGISTPKPNFGWLAVALIALGFIL